MSNYIFFLTGMIFGAILGVIGTLSGVKKALIRHGII